MRRLLLISAVLGGGLFAGCYEDVQARSDPVADQLVDGAVHLGALLPLSEGAGLSHRDAVVLAAEQVSAAWSGPPLVPVIVDSQPVRIAGTSGVADEVRRRVSLMIEAGVRAIVVGEDAAAVAAVEAAAGEDLLVITYAATSDAAGRVVPEGGVPPFHLAPSDRYLGRVLAGVAAAPGHDRLGVVRLAGDPFGDGLVTAIAQWFGPNTEKSISGALLSPDSAAGDRAALLPLLAQDPDVLIPALPAARLASVVNEVTALFEQVAWVFPHTAVSPAFVENVADLRPLDGARAVGPSPGEGESYEAFQAAFVRRFERHPGALDALAYDAVVLSAFAIARAAARGEDQRVARVLADSLVAVGSGPGIRRGTDQIPEAFTDLRLEREIEYVGARGDVDVTPAGGASGDIPIQVFSLNAGRRGFETREVVTIRAAP